MDELAEKIEEELEEFIYSSQAESLEQIVLYYLGMHASTLAVAESCTGGLVAERLTSISGSSRSFLGGAVVYSDQLKTIFAGVAPSLIAAHGAVSREVAGALAEGIRSKTSATFGLGVTGIAGPGGGSEEKPVGLGLRRCDRWQADRRCGTAFWRRSGTHSRLGQPAGARSGSPAAEVDTGSRGVSG